MVSKTDMGAVLVGSSEDSPGGSGIGKACFRGISMQGRLTQGADNNDVACRGGWLGTGTRGNAKRGLESIDVDGGKEIYKGAVEGERRTRVSVWMGDEGVCSGVVDLDC